MRSRSKGHAAVGVGSALLGATCVVLGIARPGFAGGGLLETPVWALLVTVGSVLALVGVLIMIFTFRPAPADANVVPAHVAFNSRMVVEPLTPPLAASRATAAAQPAAPGSPATVPPYTPAPPRTVPRLQPPAAPAQQRVAPSLDDMAGVTAQIQELTKRINKAGVMLATGQLSQEGYLAYVDDLKRQRANLEGVRVRHELRSS